MGLRYSDAAKGVWGRYDSFVIWIVDVVDPVGTVEGEFYGKINST